MWQETKMVYFIFMSVSQKEHILVFWLLVGIVFVVWKKQRNLLSRWLKRLMEGAGLALIAVFL